MRTQSCLVEVCERCFRCAKGCSGVGVVCYWMGELSAQSNMVKVMPHARPSVFFCSERTNTTFDKPILWINMPVNEVVLKGFSLHFLRGCLQTVGTTMYRHVGERGYRPGAREYDQRARDVNG